MRRTVVVASTALALLAALAPAASAREGNAPLSHYSGWIRYVDATGPSDWLWVDPDSHAAGTLDGVWMEARWPGRCTDPAHGDVLRVARPGHRVRCG